MAYKTKQGEALLNYLKQLDGHYASVAQIARFMSGKIGVTTIYRQLDRLVEQGLVKKCSAEGEAACYQYIGGGDCKNHFHIVCSVCGRLIHLECDEFDKLTRHLYDKHGFLTDPLRSSLYGSCRECVTNSKEKDLK